MSGSVCVEKEFVTTRVEFWGGVALGSLVRQFDLVGLGAQDSLPEKVPLWNLVL